MGKRYRKKVRMSKIFGGNNTQPAPPAPTHYYIVRVVVEMDIHEKPSAVLKPGQPEPPSNLVEQVTYKAGTHGPDIVDVLQTAARKMENHFDEMLTGRGYGQSAPTPEEGRH